jgi:hypothetical protein
MLSKSQNSKSKQPLSSALGWCLLPELPLLVRELLEHLLRCSVCDSTEQNQMKKSQNMPVWLSIIVTHKLNFALIMIY